MSIWKTPPIVIPTPKENLFNFYKFWEKISIKENGEWKKNNKIKNKVKVDKLILQVFLNSFNIFYKKKIKYFKIT